MERYTYIVGAIALAALVLVIVGLVRRRSGDQLKWWDWLLLWPLLLKQQDRLDGESARRSAKRIRIGLMVMALLILLAVVFTGGPKNPPM